MSRLVLIISDDPARIRPLAAELARRGFLPEVAPELGDPARVLMRRPGAIYIDASDGRIPEALGTLLRAASSLPPVYILTSGETGIASLSIVPMDRAWEPLTPEAGADPAASLSPTDMRAILRFARALTMARDPVEVLDQLVVHAASGVEADRASVVDVEPRHSIARVRASSAGTVARGIPLDLQKYPELARAAQEGQLAVIEDVERDPEIAPYAFLFKRRGIRTLLAAPFAPREHGSLCLLISRNNPFSPRDRAFLRLSCDITAAVLGTVEELDALLRRTEGWRESTASMRERWRRVADETPGSLAEISDEGTVSLVSKSFSEMLEYPREEVVGQPFTNYVEPASHPRWEAAVREAQEHPRRVVRLDLPLVHPTGEVTYHAVALRSPEPGRRRLIVYVAEPPSLPVAFHPDAWRALHEEGPEPRAVLDEHGCVRVANRVFREWFRIEEGTALFGAEGQPPFEPDLLARALGGEMVLSAQVQPDPGLPPMTSMLLPAREEGGAIVGVEIVARGTATGRSRAHHPEEVEVVLREKVAELEAANQRLRDMDIFRKHFISAAAHELKTPIAILQSYVEVLMGDLAEGLSDRQRSFLETVWETSARLERLISDLLDLASLEAGHLTFRLAPVAADPLLRRVAAEVQPIARKADVALVLKPGPPTFVLADEDRLAQVLSNLAVNALRYTPAGGEAEMTWQPAEATVEFRVTDNGTGIAPDDLPYIFEEFRQVPRGARHRIGTGLGLPICKKFTEAMGGSIEIQSAVGKGTTAIVTMPRAEG